MRVRILLASVVTLLRVGEWVMLTIVLLCFSALVQMMWPVSRDRVMVMFSLVVLVVTLVFRCAPDCAWPSIIRIGCPLCVVRLRMFLAV